MSKNKENNIEEVLSKIVLNDDLHYLIKFKGEKKHKLVEKNRLTKSEIKLCENILLNKKRKISDDIFSEKSKSIKKIKKGNIKRKDDLEKSKSPKKYKKRDNKKGDNESNNNSSLSSFSILKRNQKIKKQNKENNNKYSNKNISSDSDNSNISENKSKSENISESENESESEIKKTQKYEREGVLLEDKPQKILNVGHKNRNDKTLYSLVRWKQSKNIKILDSIVENKKIRQIYPQLLIDFYESKIIFLEEKIL